MGESIRLKSAAGEIGAYLATPKGTPRGGVVVVQEIFGVNHHIRAVTDSFAAQGYLALAPQYFDHIKTGIELGYPPDTIAEGRGYVMSAGFTTTLLPSVSASGLASCASWSARRNSSAYEVPLASCGFGKKTSTLLTEVSYLKVSSASSSAARRVDRLF